MPARFITESNIREIIESMEQLSEAESGQLMVDLFSAQPTLVDFITEHQFPLLQTDEKQYLYYIILIIWQSFKKQHKELPVLNSKIIGEAEEKNWEVFQKTTGKFRERLDIFFQDYPQEELLALAEDSFSEVDETITKEGREILFITCKSVIDAFHSAIS